MEKYLNFSIFIEPEMKDSYQEDSIREGDDYWLQINCADGQNLTVSNFVKLGLLKLANNIDVGWTKIQSIRIDFHLNCFIQRNKLSSSVIKRRRYF